ncbi:MAG TPA: ShlB/FhaC/HecB family hemolysin secretion/activation protein [Steroidobacteraceae bacterium]|nr:ShlB/FhaC/HecB family hemolysin secretion/activation protein [Steroidobacteraceae bacterium]
MSYLARRRGSIAAALLGSVVCLPVLGASDSGAPAEARFDVLEYRVLGNTLLPQIDVERAVYPFLGPDKSIEDVQAARAALEQAYHAAGRGTVYVDVPEQNVEGGIVRLKVTEGRLRQVRVQGARYFSGRQIRAALPAAEADTAPDLPALQHQISILNTQTPDRAVVPVLKAGPVPGTVDLMLKVNDHLPLHGSLEVNNQYTADTSQLRALASLSYDNLFNRLDSISLQYQTSPQELSELSVLVASYTHYLGEGRRLALYFVDSDSDVASLGTLAVLGKGKVYGSRLILPLVNSAESSHTLTLGVEYKDFLESIALDDDSSFRTPIGYVNLSLGESGVWRWDRLQLTESSSFNFGPRGLGNSSREFADKRFKGRPNYFYFRGNIAVRKLLYRDFSLLASLAGQYSLEPIIGNEQFAMGGADGVRGYLEAEALGDIGAKATLQLESPAWSLFDGKTQTTGFIFYDAGRVSTIEPLPDEGRNEDLRSWGVGFNFNAFDHFSASLAWADPLVDGSRTLAGDSRILFVVRSSW